MSGSLVSVILLTLLLAAPSLSQLLVFEAGLPPHTRKENLVDGSVVCLDDYPAGINIACTNVPLATYANFSVDGVQVRHEKSRPYFLAGDKIATGEIKKWKNVPTGVATIKCEASTGVIYLAAVNFVSTCPSPEPTPSGSLAPGTMQFREAGRNRTVGPVLTDGLTFCPADYRSGKYNIFCQDSDASVKAKFFIDGVLAKNEKTKPFYIAGDKDGRVRSWKGAPEGYFTIECRLGGGVKSKARVRIACDNAKVGPTPEPSPDGVITKPDGCVLIDSRLSPLSAGWEQTDSGVIFKKDNPSLGIFAKGKFPLTYKFVPTVTAHHAVVVDMTTQDSKDYNDIWVKIDGDFNLIRRGEIKEGEGDGWIKGYHNKDGRASITSSIDFMAHSISTRAILEAGKEYTIEVGGRSTMVEVHRIILFPCGLGLRKCQRGDFKWRQFMISCAGTQENGMPLV